MNYYKTNFAMMQHHNYSLSELEDMMPWEREIYTGLLMEFIEKENERIEQEERKMRRGSEITQKDFKQLLDAQQQTTEMLRQSMMTVEEREAERLAAEARREARAEAARKGHETRRLNAEKEVMFAVKIKQPMQLKRTLINKKTSRMQREVIEQNRKRKRQRIRF